jgi:uncharacterized membrane protein
MGITQQSYSRILGIDVARVLAILFMVQGHTLDVLLSPEYRQGNLFDFWLFLRGLTAPMFLTLAGFSFTVVTMRSWQQVTTLETLPWKRLMRFGIFVLLGYAMHVPARSLSDFKFVDAAGWQSWLQIDVLQCVGISLILLQLLTVMMRTPARFAWTCFALGWVVTLTAPLLWKTTSLTGLPLVDAYLNGNAGSIFPLFPWLGYILVGASTGYAYLRWRSTTALKIMAFSGASLIILGYVLESSVPLIYGDINFWKTSPTLFLMKFGGVCMALSLVIAVAEKLRFPPKLMRSVAQQSLFIYIVHIVILYGSTWNGGLRQSLGASLAPWPTFGWIAIMLVSMVAMALAWNWCKCSLPEYVRSILAVMAERLRTEPEPDAEG